MVAENSEQVKENAEKKGKNINRNGDRRKKWTSKRQDEETKIMQKTAKKNKT